MYSRQPIQYGAFSGSSQNYAQPIPHVGQSQIQAQYYEIGTPQQQFFTSPTQPQQTAQQIGYRPMGQIPAIYAQPAVAVYQYPPGYPQAPPTSTPSASTPTQAKMQTGQIMYQDPNQLIAHQPEQIYANYVQQQQQHNEIQIQQQQQQAYAIQPVISQRAPQIDQFSQVKRKDKIPFQPTQGQMPQLNQIQQQHTMQQQVQHLPQARQPFQQIPQQSMGAQQHPSHSSFVQQHPIQQSQIQSPQIQHVQSSEIPRHHPQQQHQQQQQQQQNQAKVADAILNVSPAKGPLPFQNNEPPGCFDILGKGNLPSLYFTSSVSFS